MRKILLFISTLPVIIVCAQQYISVTGRVTDYNGKPVDSCCVGIYNPDFTTAYETYTGKDGFYRLDSIKSGRYAAIYAMRLNEYPRMQAVAPEDMKLEFWAWNAILDRDVKLDIRYDKLELYGTTAFFEYGGRPELLIYTRPMSVTKVIAYPGFMDKKDLEEHGKVTVEPEHMAFEVYVDGTKTDIMSVQHLSLPNANGNAANDDCYLIQAKIPSDIYARDNKPYEIRVVGHNTQLDEWGESVYYLEPPAYRRGD